MSIVSEKKFLTEEELTTLKQIQSDTRALIAELGEIELIKLQVEKRHENAKIFLNELGEKEINFTQSIFTTYGKANINPETGEIIPLD
jgi:sulfate adenylyltransferase subunit 1 (EFTu-like GTPase family)